MQATIRRFQYATFVGLVVVGWVWFMGVCLGSPQNKEKCGVSRVYDVFLSFRGRDTRTGFADFLYNSLVVQRVRVFRDAEELPMGEEIFGELIQGIKGSKILIPIISKNYANSKSCLRELANMIKCREVCGQLIFPIFYKVRLDEVQELKGRVGEALRLLNNTVDANTMNHWKEALRSVAKIKGWESHKIANGHEGVLADMVVAKVLSELKSISLNSARPNNIINWSVRAAHHLVRKRSEGAESQCQVFLNFYDEDTRAGFTDYLHISLVNAGVHVFSVDDPSLIGKDSAEEVYTAIKNCKISIPIISRHYASCIWCLRELAQMVDCKTRTGPKLMPISYKVKPSQVQEVTNEFKEALTSHHANGFYGSAAAEWEQAFRATGANKGRESEKIVDWHEGKLVNILRELAKRIKRREVCEQLIFPIFYKVSVDEVQELKGRVGDALRLLYNAVDANAMSQWEEALRSVAQIKGWESHKIANGHEGVLVNMVVTKVLNELKTISLNSAGPNNIINWSIRAAHHLVRKRRDGVESQCEVFLNFYDEDTGAGFTNYLYINLVSAGVRVFNIDDPSLIGKDIAEEVYAAIKNCKISIPIISRNYASSMWCLRELVQIMDCKKRTRQKLMPIFYKVKPSQVREVTNEFKEALTSHRANGFPESVAAEWEEALKAIGACKGHESKKVADGHEGKVAQLVVTEVLSELNRQRYHNSVQQGEMQSVILYATLVGLHVVVKGLRPSFAQNKDKLIACLLIAFLLSSLLRLCTHT